MLHRNGYAGRMATLRPIYLLRNKPYKKWLLQAKPQRDSNPTTRCSHSLLRFNKNTMRSEFLSDAKLFANRSALFANDAESAMIACSLL